MVCFLFVGAFGRRLLSPAWAQRTIEVLDRLILDWVLPVAVFFNISSVELSRHTLGVSMACVVVTIVDATLVWLWSLVLRREQRVRRTLSLVVPLGNTAYFGLPAVTAIIGRQALPDAIIFDQIGTTLMLATYGSYVANGGFAKAATAVLEVLTFRPLWGLMAGLFAAALGVNLTVGPLAIVATVSTFSLLALSMIALGSRIYLQQLKPSPELIGGLCIRLFAGPAVLVAASLSFSNLWTISPAVVLQGGAPPMVAAALLAQRNDLDGDLAFSLCTGGLLVALVTWPLLNLLFL
jgi:predicted permease